MITTVRQVKATYRLVLFVVSNYYSLHKHEGNLNYAKSLRRHTAAIQSLLDQVVNNKEGLFPDVEYQAKLTVAMGKLLVCLYFMWILYSGC